VKIVIPWWWLIERLENDIPTNQCQIKLNMGQALNVYFCFVSLQCFNVSSLHVCGAGMQYITPSHTSYTIGWERGLVV
jgi:hypothetical protein